MPFLQRSDSIPANNQLDNCWTGTQFEFAPYNAYLELGILGSATGLQTTVATGEDTLCIAQAVSVVRLANSYPLYPDDYTITDVVGAGERIIETLRNTTGGALTHFSSIKLTPI